MEKELADDTLRGVKRIANYIGENERAVYHKLSKGILPGGKEGSGWISSKSRLRQHYARLTSGESV
jgi:hypothetical protein